MVVLKFISLVFAIWFSIINFGSIKQGTNVPMINLIIQSVSIALFCFIQFNLF